MNRLEKLKEIMEYDLMVINDPKMIEYYIGKEYEPGERFIALCVFKNEEPFLIVNALKTVLSTAAQCFFVEVVLMIVFAF